MHQHKRVERLMLFVALAEKLSFTQAAKSLSISKGYLSEQIKRLEQELQCPLVIRTTRSVRLTPEGKRAYAQAREIKTQAIALEKQVFNEHHALSGELKITAPKMFSERFLTDICRGFRELHPDMVFIIDSSYTTYDLNHFDFDLGFRATRNPPENMRARHLFDYQHCIVAAPEYLAKHGKPLAADHLNSHVCLSTPHQVQWPLRSGHVTTQGWMVNNQNQVLKQQAIAGEGLVRIADYFVEQELEQGMLEKVLEHEYVEGQGIYLFYPQSPYPSAKLSAFVAWVERYFAGRKLS
ncbi:LysR family transcriptional regulator [Echinimonas agarilytica]|uniref:LysR family transcriptional regulator n=1 Tax=Echinimonas agarilytica TaxID=1215918 RepID=A0AA42B6K1_9GAMM|nr:LysR family transcriptional regulator [Echinimonas agarilytica]MCM2678862.1 LysR family transcriptional regulator [Echinimonas agarilytica]